MSPEPPAAPGRAPEGADPASASAVRPRLRRASEVRTAADVRTLARNRLIESRLTPNAISVTGYFLNVVAAVLVTQRLFFLAGLAFIVGSVMDTLDGRYSRMSGKGTAFGAFLDSTLDRAEALGVECKVGLATRPVRVVILSIGLLFARGASLGVFHLLAPAIYVMAVLTTFTVLQRVLHVRRALNKADRGLATPPA